AAGGEGSRSATAVAGSIFGRTTGGDSSARLRSPNDQRRLLRNTRTNRAISGEQPTSMPQANEWSLGGVWLDMTGSPRRSGATAHKRLYPGAAAAATGAASAPCRRRAVPLHSSAGGVGGT